MSEEYSGLGDLGSPREYLRIAEHFAVQIRKNLRSHASRMRGADQLRSMDDAVARAELVEQVARRFRNSTAADAIDAAEYVEIQLQLLCDFIDDFLAS